MAKISAVKWLEEAISDKKINYIDFDKFTGGTEIGTGSFGTVYKFELKDSELVVVLKKCPNFDSNISLDKIIIEDFKNELDVLIKVSEDQNIIKFYGVTKDSNGLYYMVLQYANEGTLHEYLIANFTRLRWTNKLNIAYGIACGLSFLHNKEIVHRDLHSRNILIHQGNPKIADFASSKQINSASMFSSSNFIGVLEYTDPQCIIYDESKRSKKSDVYSFGVILWEISSGKPPFQSIKSTMSEVILSFNICVRGKREKPIEDTPSPYIKLYEKCWDNNPDERPETKLICDTLKQIIDDETHIEKSIENLQSIDLDRIREENLTQIGELKGQFLEDLNEFKEDLELYVKPRGAWKASTLGGKEEMKKGDVEKVVYDFLTSKDKLISQDKEQLKDAFAEFLITGENTSLIKTVNRFFVPENQLTLEDIGVLNVAANQFLALNDKKALKLMKMAINEFLELPKESVLKNSIRNFMASPFALENNLSLENEIFIKSKLALEHQITKEDVKILKRCLNDIKDLEKTANNLLALKAKEVLEIAVDKFLTSKRKRVLLILGSGGTGKSTFNRLVITNVY